jgi:hypothetical protein
MKDHTPVPWIKGAIGRLSIVHNYPDKQNTELVATVQPTCDEGCKIAEANRDFILRACNAHAEAIDLIQTIVNEPNMPRHLRSDCAKFLDRHDFKESA